MSIQVKFFASLRERMGRAEEALDPARTATVGEAWAQVSEGRDVPAQVLAAVNMEYADMAHALRDGDEVAFFPPVTGG